MPTVLAAWLELAAFVLVLTLVTPFLGGYLAAVFTGGRHPLGRAFGPLETAVYRVCRIDRTSEMSWKTYLAAAVTFTFVSIAALFALLCTQQWLPLNPQHFPNLPPL